MDQARSKWILRTPRLLSWKFVRVSPDGRISVDANALFRDPKVQAFVEQVKSIPIGTSWHD